MITKNGKEVTAIYKDGREIVERYKGGRLVYSAAKDYEGYPLAISSKKEKEVKSYTIYGNTSADAKGVGDWDGSSFVMPIRVGSKNMCVSDPSKYTKVADYYTCPIPPKSGDIISAKAVCVGEPMVGIIVGLVPCGTRYSEFGILTQLVRINGATSMFSNIRLTDAYTDTRIAIYASEEAQIAEIFRNYEIQFEYGSQNTAYSPYFAPTLYPSLLTSPLHKIGDIVDYKESSGMEHHAFGVVDASTIDWGRYGGTEVSGKKIFYCSIIADMKKEYARFILSSYQRRTWKPLSTLPEMTAQSHPTLPRIYLCNEQCDTAEELIESLKGVILVYELATPTDIQGEPLPTLMLQQGDNIITTDTEVQPSNIKAKA